MGKRIRFLVLAGILSAASTMTSFAGWEQAGAQWKYSDNGTYLVNGWYWLDGNNDNIAECYYLDSNGVMAVNTVVEGYTVNESGAWVVNGVIQAKVVNAGGSSSSGQQNNGGIPNMDDLLSGVTISDFDMSDAQAGDSTGLPPMHAGNGGSSSSGGRQNNGGIPSLDDITGSHFGDMDMSDVQAGDSTGLPSLH